MTVLANIDAEIARTEAALRRLHAERREAVRSFNAEIVADFDAGKSTAELADERGLTYSAVQGVLYRAGRTKVGRMLTRARLEMVGGHSGAAR